MLSTNRTILLLEDNPADRMLVESLLETAGAPCKLIGWCDRVDELEQRLALSEPDVVLCDLCVIDSEGIETFRRVARAVAGRCPIVVQSGEEDVSLAVAAIREGAADFVLKRTLDAEILHRALRYALERHALATALDDERRRWQLALDGCADVVWEWNVGSSRIALSPQFRALFGEPEPHWQTLADCFSARDRDDVQAAIADCVRGVTDRLDLEARLDLPAPDVWVRVRGAVGRDASGHAHRFAGSLTDIRPMRQDRARLEHLALHDPLTMLPNRTLLRDRLGHALAHNARERKFVGLLFVDLDRFKALNDSFGHASGDAALREVGRRLRACVRPGDTVARLGGDEFCVLLTSLASKEEGAAVASRISTALAQAVVVEGSAAPLGASIGLAFAGPEERDVDTLLRAADLAVYEAKRTGRGRVQAFRPELAAEVDERREIEDGLRQALQNSSLELRYQPIVCLRTGRIDSLEALLRWRCDKRGEMPIARVIEVAEESGLIVPLGGWVLERAMQSLMAWSASGLARAMPRRLAVNVSPQQLFGGDLRRQVEEALARTGFEADRLALEITENALCKDPEHAAHVLDAIRALGVEVHLDDFGVGYSSLGYLQNLPVDCLKIDRSFVARVHNDRETFEIVRAIVDLAHGLGKRIVAEGVETAEQLAVVRRLGCDLVQGYLLARPSHHLPRRCSGVLAAA